MPVSAPAAEPKAAELELGKRVAEMLQVGFARGPHGAQDSQRLYESLHQDAGHNPRVDYAHGLVLLRLLRNKDAKAEFLAAAKQPGTPYPPAWEALIWSHFTAKEYDDGYDRLIEFMMLLLDQDGLAESTTER